ENRQTKKPKTKVSGFLFSISPGLVNANWRELVLDRRAIGAGIAVGKAEHGPVFGVQHIKLHAVGQIDIGGDQAEAMRLFAACGLDVSDPACGELPVLDLVVFKSVRHDKPPVLISTTRVLGWTCLRAKSIFSNPFSNAAAVTSMPSARTKLRKNCRAAMP